MENPLRNLSSKGKGRYKRFKCFNDITGKRIINFHRHCWDDKHGGSLYIAHEGFLGIQEEGIVGHVYGGANGYADFIDWVLDTGTWCFNPVDIKEYAFCRRSNAYIDKDEPFIHKVVIENKGRYVFVRDEDDDAYPLIKLIRKAEFPQHSEVIWQRK